MLTLREAAEQLGMTPDTLRQAIARGVLKATRTPGPPNRALWIVEQEEIDRYRAEHRSIIHECPPEGSGIMPCCGRTPFEAQKDRMTLDPKRVTCRGKS